MVAGQVAALLVVARGLAGQMVGYTAVALQTEVSMCSAEIAALLAEGLSLVGLRTDQELEALRVAALLVDSV